MRKVPLCRHCIQAMKLYSVRHGPTDNGESICVECKMNWDDKKLCLLAMHRRISIEDRPAHDDPTRTIPGLRTYIANGELMRDTETGAVSRTGGW